MSLWSRASQRLQSLFLEPKPEAKAKAEHNANALPYPVGAGAHSIGGGGGWTWSNGQLPGSERDWKSEAGNAEDNSAVSILLGFICYNFVESPLTVKRHTGGNKYEIVPGHAIARLIKRPNPFWTRSQLLSAVLASRFLDGNAYLHKVRSAAGKVVELWWLPHWLIKPVADEDGFLSHYEYTIEGKTQTLDVDDIVHLKVGADRDNLLKGASPLKALLREICTDNEILVYTYSLLKNMGLPGAIMTPKDDSIDVTEAAQKKIKRLWMEKTTGDHRGEPLVLTTPWDITNPGFNPGELLIEKISEIGEARLAGATGIPAVVVQFMAGLRNVNAKASYEESIKQAYGCCIMPLQREMCEWLDLQLLPELGDPNSEYTCFDTSEISSLQENKNEQAKRADDGFKANTLKLNEARAERGQPEDKEFGDQYLWQLMPAPGAMLSAMLGNKPGEENPDEAQAGTVATQTLNGIQIQAALEVIERLQLGQITDMIAIEMLVGIGFERTRAEQMAHSALDADAPATTPEETDETTPPVTEEEQAKAKKLRKDIGSYWRKRAAHYRSQAEARTS